MDTSAANNRVLSSKVGNVSSPIKKANPTLPSQEQPQNFALLEVVGGPSTGSGTGLVIKIGNKNFLSPTTVAFTADQEAAAAAVAWQAAIDAASTGPTSGGYGPGVITVTNPSAPSPFIRIETANGMPLNLTDEHSFDATTGLDSVSGTHIDNAMLHEATTAGAGYPNLWSDGFALDPIAKDDSASTPVVIRAELKNLSGGPARAFWQVWWWFDYLGWEVDQEVGTRSIVQISGNELQPDTISVSAPGASRIAVVFVDGDDNAGGAFPVDASFSAWGITAS